MKNLELAMIKKMVENRTQEKKRLDLITENVFSYYRDYLNGIVSYDPDSQIKISNVLFGTYSEKAKMNKMIKDSKITYQDFIKTINKKIFKKCEKQIKKYNLQLNEVVNSPDFKKDYLRINIVWSRSGHATATDGTFKSHAGGGGYDKQSTVVSSILNQNKSILKLLYKIKNKNIDKQIGYILGYGVSEYVFPYFQHGVGMDSIITVLKNLKMKVQFIQGKTEDVLIING